MTVARQDDLTLQLKKLASWRPPVAAVMGLRQLLVSSSTAENAACDSISRLGLTALPHVGLSQPSSHLKRPRLPVLRRPRHGGRAEMSVHTTQPLYPSALSPSLWPS